MTMMQIREMTSCGKHARAVIVLEDVSRRVTLTFYAESGEAMRLARQLFRDRGVCHPIYDFIGGVLEAFQATPIRVVLDDVRGKGIGGLVYLRHAGSELAVPCYPPDALALALRADLPIYATPRALDHAEPAALAGSSATDGGDVSAWLERVKPEDFSPNVDDREA
jgi:bifunctional DNase/RNase